MNFVGQTKVKAVEGQAVFSSLGLTLEPGLNASLDVRATGVSIAPEPTLIQIRPCVRGEVSPVGLRECTRCPFGQFSWNVSDSVCHLCPVGAVCFGGDHVAALEIFWRFNDSAGVCATESGLDGCALLECDDPSACRGIIESPVMFASELLLIEEDNQEDNQESPPMLRLRSTATLSSNNSQWTTTYYRENASIVILGIERQIRRVAQNEIRPGEFQIELDVETGGPEDESQNLLQPQNGIYLYTTQVRYSAYSFR